MISCDFAAEIATASLGVPLWPSLMPGIFPAYVLLTQPYSPKTQLGGITASILGLLVNLVQKLGTSIREFQDPTVPVLTWATGGMGDFKGPNLENFLGVTTQNLVVLMTFSHQAKHLSSEKTHPILYMISPRHMVTQHFCEQNQEFPT